MENFIKIILEASVTAGIAVFAVMLIRLAMKKAPKRWAYALWAVVFFRCLCPFSVESGLSVFNAVNAVPERTAEVEQLETLPQMAENSEIENILPVHTNLNTYGYQTAASVYPAVLEDVPAAEAVPTKKPVNKYAIMFAVWAAGAGAMALYGIVSYVLLMGRLCTAVKTEEGVYESDRISTAFSAGFFPPKIYLPCGLFEEEKKLIVAHERVHIRRLDYIVKPVAFLALAVHWFNPLIWLAFALMTRDMELSCDEAVLKIFGAGEKKAYSEALLRVSMKRSGLADNYGFLPLAFAETGIKGRVRNVLKYKKPTVIVTVIAAAVVVAACVVLGTNAKSADDTTSGEIEYVDYQSGRANRLRDDNGNKIYLYVDKNFYDDPQETDGVYYSRALIEGEEVQGMDSAAFSFGDGSLKKLIMAVDMTELKINSLEVFNENGKSFLKTQLEFTLAEDAVQPIKDGLIRYGGDEEPRLLMIEGGGKDRVYTVSAEYELTQNGENGYAFILKDFEDIPVYVNAELIRRTEDDYIQVGAGEKITLLASFPFEIGTPKEFEVITQSGESITVPAYNAETDKEKKVLRIYDILCGENTVSIGVDCLNYELEYVDIEQAKIERLFLETVDDVQYFNIEMTLTPANEKEAEKLKSLIKLGEYDDRQVKCSYVESGGDLICTFRAGLTNISGGQRSFALALSGFEDVPVYVYNSLVKKAEVTASQNYDTLEAGETSYSFESGEKVVINNIPDKTMKVNDYNNGKLRNSMTLNSDPDASGKERSVWVGMQGKNNELDRQCCVDLSYVDIIGLSIEDIEVSSEQYTVTMKITYGNREGSGFYVNPQELNAPMRLIKHSDTESMLYLTAEYDRETVKEYQIDLYGFDDIPVETGDGFMIRNNAAMTYPEGHIYYHQVISGNENLSLDGHIPAYFVCGLEEVPATGVVLYDWNYQNAYTGEMNSLAFDKMGENYVQIMGMKTKVGGSSRLDILDFGSHSITDITLEDMYTETSGTRTRLYTKIKVASPTGEGLMNLMAVNSGNYEMAVAALSDSEYLFTVITEYNTEDVDSFAVILGGFEDAKKYVHPDLLLNKGGFYTAEYMAAYENASAEEVYISDNLINIVLYDNGLFQIEEFFSSYIPTFCSQKQYRREGGSLILTFDDGSELCFDETYSTGEPSKAALTFNEKASRRTDARSRDIPWFNDGAVFTFDEEWLEVERKSEEERKAEEAERKLRELDEQERFRAEEALKSSYPALQYPVSANINTAYIEDTSYFNKGINFAVQEGTPVYAAGKGTVINADDDQNGYGLCVIIDHGAGEMHTVYAHLSEISVSKGDEVNAGDLIGYSGKTGNTYGAQLHFEVRIDGRHVDPAEYISPVLSYPAQGDISENYGDGHNGIDFTAAKGEEIYAAYDGTVTEVGTGWNGGYGHSVTIDHGSGMETVYAHLSEISVSEGDKVHKRDVIGYAGSTGDSVGTHLHFEVKINGRQANPMNYLGLRHFDGDDTEMETIELKGKTYYLVFTEAQLRAIGSGVYGWDKNYMQQCDIELSSDEWQPIGTRENPFTGSYNGNGFEIKGLTMTDPYASLAGMFGYAKNAKIYNITLRDIEIEKAGSSAESMSSGAVVAINLGSEVYDNTVY